MFNRHNYYMTLSLALLLNFCSSQTNSSKLIDIAMTNGEL